MRDRRNQSTGKDPDQITDCLQATATTVLVYDLAAERPENECGQFKTLQTERNADDGDA